MSSPMIEGSCFEKSLEVSPSIQKLRPYEPGRDLETLHKVLGIQKLIKLASNENPWGPSSKVLEILKNSLSNIYLYPDATCNALKEALARKHRVTSDQIFVGNGSDEIFDLLIRTLVMPPDEGILVSEGAFNAYVLSAQAHGCQVVSFPLQESGQIDIGRWVDHINHSNQSHILRLIFLPTVNNPTGMLVPKKDLLTLVEAVHTKTRAWLVLDEAYHEYVESEDYISGEELRRRYPRILVTRTFSKVYGLAGLRVGYMLAPASLNSLLDRVRKPFHVNRLAQRAALEAIADESHLKFVVDWNRVEKRRWEQELKSLGLRFFPTQGNFFLIHFGYPFQVVDEFFLKRGIIGRPVAGYGFMDWMRISIGKPDENDMVFGALREWVKEKRQTS